MSSISPPKAEAPIKTGRGQSAQWANGNASVAKAMKCKILSLTSGVEGGASRGHSIATVITTVTISVRGMSRCLRIYEVYRPE